jgi:hypothetical protein
MIVHDKHEIARRQEDCMTNADRAVAAAPAEASGTQGRHKIFGQLNRWLWFCWFVLPLWCGAIAWQSAVWVPAALVNASPVAAGCMRLLPDPAGMSFTGKVLYWSSFAFEFSIYFIVLWLLHRMVRKFVSGQIFVSHTLNGLRSLGYLLIVWPFIQVAVRYLLQTALKAHQDIPSYWPVKFSGNFGIVAMGLFLLALKAVIEHGIDIKADNELTI